MKLYKLSKNAYEYYKNNVKGNENITYMMCRRKLTRNILLASECPIKNNRRLFYYGNLSIIVNNKNQIVWIQNYHDRKQDFKVDKERYEELNKKLRINDNPPGLIEKLTDKIRLAFAGGN